ncbi:unnamed protein product [Effrenium voratum]|uniref:Uncharacterized protein n=1 Tax=Effrenium voratum TaxID=2562239 RepID=A0AA36INU8_9DINO|nr:unnamed protein product [Effrenium voratum]
MATSSPTMVLKERNASPEDNKILTPADAQKECTKDSAKKETPEPSLLSAPSPMRRRKLEPSLQAWVASRSAQPNVAPSEVSAPIQTRGRERERYSPHDWKESLRQEAESKQFWGKEFQPTVPQGPRLRTEERSRSRSCSSSREWTPQGTPTRRSMTPRSMTPGRGMPAKEQVAVQHYLSRMALARLDSPMRKFAFGSSIERGVAPSPARSSSRASESSRDSRLSHLSRPRSLSRDQLSTEDRQCLQAAEERRALRKQLRRNRRKYKEALLGGHLAERCTEHVLTTPMAPELKTSFRARLRSSSWHGDRSLSVGTAGLSVGTVEGADARVFLKKHPNPREQAAIERHLEQRFARLADRPLPFKEMPVPVGPTRVAKEVVVPKGADHEEWIQAAESVEERAERARAVALAQRDSEWEQQRSQLCVFRASASPEKVKLASPRSPRSPEALRPVHSPEARPASPACKEQEIAHAD